MFENKKLMIGLGVAAVLLLAVVALRLSGNAKNGGSSQGETVIVAPAHPEDPRFRPSPQLSGGEGSKN